MNAIHRAGGILTRMTADGLANVSEDTAPVALKVIAALMYGVASFAIVFANKWLFATVGFPSFKFVALCQYVATAGVLWWRNRAPRATEEPRSAAAPAGSVGVTVTIATTQPKSCASGRLYPPLSWGVFWAVMPLPLLFFANTVTGLGATKRLNMPMFVLLRRFSILMTMGFEAVLLQRTFPLLVRIAVFLMVVGAGVAAAGDLQLDTTGYAFILANDFFTALQGVILRRKLDDGQRRREREEKDAAGGERVGDDDAAGITTKALAADSLLFYNALFSIPLGLLLFLVDRTDVRAVIAFAGWLGPGFVSCFAASLFLGFGMNYSYFLCTKVNSPLTTTVVGSMKNVLSSYLGMLFSDYPYTVVNFIGVNIGVFATVLYSFAEMRKVRARDRARENASPAPPLPGQSAATPQPSQTSTTATSAMASPAAAHFHKAMPSRGGDAELPGTHAHAHVSESKHRSA
eukprot:CAMPEP_0174834484 /NCGR_PEP_ID=MMETSP1114-20130205/4853_1 /TAXON_ID=312471 /ORGANISM="Neobodo designis, Strain CCAP 1951/1" /LENGTH=460 /DNA_ID=CAMNT_0016068395 /DNA_START=40 /DNA_END=1419 /DNA_ORIENTATION=-